MTVIDGTVIQEVVEAAVNYHGKEEKKNLIQTITLINSSEVWKYVHDSGW